MDRIRKNQKVTNKRKTKSEDNAEVVQVVELVKFMKMEKSKLRKLKNVYERTTKNEETRKLNTKFQKDPSRIYSSFKEMISEQAADERT